MDLELGNWAPHEDWKEWPSGSGALLLGDPWGLEGRSTGLSAEVWNDKDGWQFRIGDGAARTVPSQNTAMFLAEAGLALAVWDFMETS